MTRVDPGRSGGGTSASKDFRLLAETGQRPGLSRLLGGMVVAARDAVARLLIRLGATPNRITLAGCLMTLGAGYCLARGASQQLPFFQSGQGPVGWWPLAAAGFLILSGACDMLDGAVARVGGLSTPFGGILDSALDRISDMAVYLGCALHFALMDNLTYQCLALVALMNAVLISYIKARAENIIPDCSVGYWLRGERFAAVLIACLCGHVPAVLWQQALLPAFTAARRLVYAYRVVAARSGGGPPPARGPAPGWRGWFQPWRYARGSVPYDLVTGLNVAYIIFAGYFWPWLNAAGGQADPLGNWLRP